MGIIDLSVTDAGREMSLSEKKLKSVRVTVEMEGSTMAKDGHLWAIGYDNMARADQVREEIINLGWGPKHYLMLDDVAVAVRHLDGSFTLDRKAFPTRSNVVGCSVVGFVAGLVLGVPLTGATIGALVGGAGSVAVLTSVGIGDDFVREVKELMKPGTSALLVLDHRGG